MTPWKLAKRVVVFIVGMTVVLFGIALIVLPGPAIVVIPIGLAILATEFVWAQRLLKKVKEQGAKAFPAVFRTRNGTRESSAEGRESEPRS